MIDPVRRSANVFTAIIGAVFVPIGAGIGYLSGARGPMVAVAALTTGCVAGYIVRRISLGVAEGSGRAFLALVQPSGKSSPYEQEFSGAQSLVAAGDIDGAIAWYDAAMERMPANVLVRVQNADLHARHGRPERAEALFLEARRLTSARDHELYCTQRLIDLRLGALGAPARALPELRRLMDRFPDSREARGAAVALARFKRELPPGE